MTKSKEEISKRYIKGSIDAYMKRKKNLNWIIGVIRSSEIKKEDLIEIFITYYKLNIEKTRFQKLEKSCRELNYI